MGNSHMKRYQLEFSTLAPEGVDSVFKKAFGFREDCENIPELVTSMFAKAVVYYSYKNGFTCKRAARKTKKAIEDRGMFGGYSHFIGINIINTETGETVK